MNSPQNRVPWILTRTGVLVMLFFVTGLMGLPLLAKSPAFTKRQKLLLSILVSIYTLVIVAIMILFFIYIYRLASSLLNP